VKPLFVDSGFWIALEADDDQHHADAVACWTRLAGQHPLLVTTTYVLDETATFFSRRGRHAKAVQLGDYLLGSSSVEVVHEDPDLFRDAWALFASRDDQRYSLTDCVSFVVMQQRGLTQVLGFDRHFQHFGYELFVSLA
jgi:predicted nucleic acid-binding protein